MSKRTTILATGEIYHLFNRAVARQPILTRTKDLQRFLDIVNFYRFKDPPFRYSHYYRFQPEQKVRILTTLYKTSVPIVEIYAFSLMPNHFHFLVKQRVDQGIKLFASHIQNSFAKYYNTKYKRSGSLFQEMFKAERIETDEQFIHVARYIHINQLTGFIIKEFKELETYPWTSYPDYMGKRQLPFLNKELLLGYFPKLQKLREFTLDQVGYQRTLEGIKHLTFD
ncbi:hypothetical protein A2699_04795 [Candidatus Gottesmanbacteria bacterium RIFCSPHIGHO2_01_FULL_43_15]|nr:MAG: hypothetical protein A2699_04795 [Candidatus Gottesmanbacteria bacterium RIFCSPHIGHO2_01_FULL_43_15]